jgi:hypothetical protein
MATKPTTTITEDDIYKKKVTDPYNEAAKEYKTVYDNRVAEIDKNITAQKDAADVQAQQQLDNADKKYRRQYDANAIQEIVDQKALNERMANLGLSKSGLNATQQTAIALARGNRDASTTASRNQFITDTELALQDMYNQAEAERASKKLAAQQQYADDLNNTKLGYENAYNEYLNKQAELENDRIAERNKWYVELVKGNINADQYYQLTGEKAPATGTVTTATNVPYISRVYKKVGDDLYYDPIDKAEYTSEQINDKLAGISQDKRESIIDGLDDLELGTYYTPSGNYYNGVLTDANLMEYILKNGVYGNNVNDILNGLYTLGFNEKDAKAYLDMFVNKDNYSVTRSSGENKEGQSVSPLERLLDEIIPDELQTNKIEKIKETYPENPVSQAAAIKELGQYSNEEVAELVGGKVEIGAYVLEKYPNNPTQQAKILKSTGLFNDTEINEIVYESEEG